MCLTLHFNIYHVFTSIFMLKLNIVSSPGPHLWCCQTPSAFPPLSLQSYPRAPKGRTSHPQTPVAGLHLPLSLLLWASPLPCHLLVSLLGFWLGFVLSKNKQTKISTELEYWNTAKKRNTIQETTSKRRYHSNLGKYWPSCYSLWDVGQISSGLLGQW